MLLISPGGFVQVVNLLRGFLER
ncbi:hypothetical protein IL54_2425 [Sphingobium sp. ba1]|nr:hypothetical protein IL54_2425 [Sphingobium sp. ba1]